MQTMSRNEKKDIKRRTADASRLDNFNDIGDIGEFEEMAELSKSITKSKKSSSSEGILEEGTTMNYSHLKASHCSNCVMHPPIPPLLLHTPSFFPSPSQSRRRKARYPWIVPMQPKHCREP